MAGRPVGYKFSEIIKRHNISHSNKLENLTKTF